MDVLFTRIRRPGNQWVRLRWILSHFAKLPSGEPFGRYVPTLVHLKPLLIEVLMMATQ